MELINVYLDMNPLTGRPFYVGIGLYKRCHYKKRCNRFHKALVETFPDKNFKRIILYKNISLEKAYTIETQIIKRCGRLYNNTGCLANVHKGGPLEFFKTRGCNRGVKMKDIYGDFYSHHQQGKPFLYMYDENTRREKIKESRIKMLNTKKERLTIHGKTEGELNIGKNKQKRIQDSGFTEKELEGFQRSANKNRGRTMKDATKNPNWVCWRKGKTHKELFGDDYVNPRGKNSDYTPGYISPSCNPFKLTINEDIDIYCLNEEDFQEKTKINNKVLQKLKRDGIYYIKRRQHNTRHNYTVGDTFKYYTITIDEYKNLH